MKSDLTISLNQLEELSPVYFSDKLKYFDQNQLDQKSYPVNSNI